MIEHRHRNLMAFLAALRERDPRSLLRGLDRYRALGYEPLCGPAWQCGQVSDNERALEVFHTLLSLLNSRQGAKCASSMHFDSATLAVTTRGANRHGPDTRTRNHALPEPRSPGEHELALSELRRGPYSAGAVPRGRQLASDG